MKTHRTLLVGGLLAVVGTTLFTGKVVVAKIMYQHGLGPVEVLALRMAFALPFFLLPAVRDMWRPATRPVGRDIALIGLMGVLGYYAASMFDFYGVQYISTALERMILNMYPSAVMLLGICFLGRNLDPRLIVSLVIGYAGIALMMHEELALANGPGDRPFLGALLVGASVLTYSTSVLGAEGVMKRVGSRRFTSLAMTLSCFAVLAHYFAQSGFVPPSRDPAVVGMGAFIGFFCTVVPAYAFNRAVQLIGAQRVGLFGFAGVGISFAFSSALLGEAFTPVKTLGIAVAAAGALVVFTSRKETPELSLQQEEPSPAKA